MTSHLQIALRTPTCARTKHRPKGLPRRSGAKAGWTPERRARQAALARKQQPWRHSTGPRTPAGKALCAMNALRHGCRSREWLAKVARVRRALRLAARNNEAIRLFMRRRILHEAALRQRRILAGLAKQMLRPRLAGSSTEPKAFQGDTADFAMRWPV